jgi:hypothetical protein
MHESFWEEVERSRQLTEHQRSQDTLELIDRVRELNLAGIRMQFPNATEEEVDRIYAQRRAILKDLELRF